MGRNIFNMLYRHKTFYKLSQFKSDSVSSLPINRPVCGCVFVKCLSDYDEESCQSGSGCSKLMTSLVHVLLKF